MKIRERGSGGKRERRSAVCDLGRAFLSSLFAAVWQGYCFPVGFYIFEAEGM